jgi:tetratricopeptide (TPR) repeat protein
MRLRAKGAVDNHWHYLIRFFRKAPHIRWAGRGHEVIVGGDESRLDEGGIIYGYSDAHNQDPDRMMRIMLKTLMDSELTGEKPGTRTLYYLAREYWYRKNWDRALFWFQERTKELGFRAECADAWLYIARIHWATGKPEEAREAALKSLILAPDCRETLQFLAEMSFPEQAAVWNRFAGIATNEGVLFKRA